MPDESFKIIPWTEPLQENHYNAMRSILERAFTEGKTSTVEDIAADLDRDVSSVNRVLVMLHRKGYIVQAKPSLHNGRKGRQIRYWKATPEGYRAVRAMVAHTLATREEA